jgi:hypothetical protein
MPITVTKGVTTDSSALMAHLRDFSLVMGKTLGETVREQAGLFCEDMVKYSRPFAGKTPGSGNTKGAKDTGAQNVRLSIRKIFRPVESSTKKSIAALGNFDVFKLWNKRKGHSVRGKGAMIRWTQFRQKYGGGRAPAFVARGDMATLKRIHKSLRTDNGKGPLSAAARSAKEPFAIVEKDADLERYIKAEQKKVGELKSAYFFAAKRIKAGKVRIPAWAQQPEGESSATGIDEVAKPMMPTVTVGNKIGGKAGNDRFVRIALSHRAYAMRVVMAARLNKEKTPLWVATAQGKVSGTTSRYF